jgi:hypothetical protein
MRETQSILEGSGAQDGAMLPYTKHFLDIFLILTFYGETEMAIQV